MTRPVYTAVFASLVLAGTSLFLAMDDKDAPPPTVGRNQALADLQQRITTLESQLAAASQPAQSALPANGLAADANLQRNKIEEITDEQIAMAVGRWLERNGADLESLAMALQATKASDGEVSIEDALAQLAGNSNMWNGNDELYRKLFEAGKLDELIDTFKQRAKANPNDPQAHLDLGNAYLAYLQFDQSKWQMSMLADKSFDEVLDIDENHWEARFTKAMSYSFWPDALGKKKDAIAHFERLVDQQDTLPIADHQAQTYVFLGNLLEQRGESERAREIWQRGLGRHPNSSELQGLLGR